MRFAIDMVEARGSDRRIEAHKGKRSSPIYRLDFDCLPAVNNNALEDPREYSKKRVVGICGAQAAAIAPGPAGIARLICIRAAESFARLSTEVRQVKRRIARRPAYDFGRPGCYPAKVPGGLPIAVEARKWVGGEDCDGCAPFHQKGQTVASPHYSAVARLRGKITICTSQNCAIFGRRMRLRLTGGSPVLGLELVCWLIGKGLLIMGLHAPPVR